jgi:signal transduction histidine kinase
VRRRLRRRPEDVWALPARPSASARPRGIRGRLKRVQATEQDHLAGVRELDALKDEFVGLVSQELRTPLTSVRGYLDLVLDGSAGELTPDQSHYLEVAARSCDRLQRLVDELLLIAHAGAGRLSLEWTRLGLTELVRDVLDALRPAAEERGVELVLVSEGKSPLLADGPRLGQLVETLAAGALVQTPPGGRVEVRARVEDGAAVLEVAAPGSELAIPGSGLSLSVARAIADAHGGTVDVAGDRRGTTVTVRVPTHLEGQQPSEEEAA